MRDASMHSIVIKSSFKAKYAEIIKNVVTWDIGVVIVQFCPFSNCIKVMQ